MKSLILSFETLLKIYTILITNKNFYVLTDGFNKKAFIEVLNEDSSENNDYFEEQPFDDYLNDAQVILSKNIQKNINHLIPPYVEVPIDHRRVCIYPNWSILRDSNVAKIYPEDIPADLCTHIHYAYANIDVRTLQLSPSQYQDFNNGDHGAVNFLSNF